MAGLGTLTFQKTPGPGGLPITCRERQLRKHGSWEGGEWWGVDSGSRLSRGQREAHAGAGLSQAVNPTSPAPGCWEF